MTAIAVSVFDSFSVLVKIYEGSPTSFLVLKEETRGCPSIYWNY